MISSNLKNRIIEKASSQRVTIIVGPTGCGKSTIVPQILLDEFGGPILCTQPRRLAVVALATHVAKQRNVILGEGEVGYHVGQQNHSTSNTKLLFATAGILLEELKSNGLEALSTYKCIIIDECHERSPESDLCLAIIKSFMRVHPNARIHVVLMSATFDHGRYRSFFSEVPGCEHIDTVQLETVQHIDSFYKQVKTLYLEEIIKDFGFTSMVNFERRMRLDPDAELAGTDGGKSLSSDLLKLIVLMVQHLDSIESEDAVFLIFAPTYRHLEQCFDSLTEALHGKLFLSVLHSSVDIEDCLQSMRVSRTGTCGNPKRKVLLASSIADSSVTIPNVTCVIDTCRSLQVRWDMDAQSHTSKAVWASKSTCDQRRGRTGRTCPGKVFRLVNNGFYINRLNSWDEPQLLLSSCQNEVLSLLTSEHRVVSDPVVLLGRCMDPPPRAAINQAVRYLKSIGACEEIVLGKRTKIIASDYGRLLSSFPFVVAESRAILLAARYSYLHEALTLWAIRSLRPYPIIHYFGDKDRSLEALQLYKGDVEPQNPKSVALANLSAYMFWDVAWNNGRGIVAKHRFQRCSRSTTEFVPKNDFENRRGPFTEADFFDVNHISCSSREKADCDVWAWTEQAEAKHVAWCKEHQINPTSVRAISEVVDSTMHMLFQSKNEPEWLRCSHPEPLWRRPNDWQGDVDMIEMFHVVYGRYNSSKVIKVLTSLWDGEFDNVSSSLSILSGTPQHSRNGSIASITNIPPICSHFLSGNCIYGTRCRNSHTLTGERPRCRFFASGTCAKGEDCVFSHDFSKNGNSNKLDSDPLRALSPILPELQLNDGAIGWYKQHGHELLLLGDGNFSFSQALSKLACPARVSTTLEQSHHSFGGAQFFTGIDATRVHKSSLITMLVQSGSVHCSAWNFPFTGVEENDDSNIDLLSGTFLSLSLLFGSKLSKQKAIQFGLALQGDQFSRWYVLRSARRSGWILRSWGYFDHDFFPGYTPCRISGKAFPVENARFYVFQLVG